MIMMTETRATEFEERMISLGYNEDQIQLFEEPTKLDYEDDDGDEWELLAYGFAAKGPEKHFHALTTVGLIAEIDGNSVKFYDGDQLRQHVLLNSMSSDDKPNIPQQRYMRALCEGDESAIIDDVENRIIWIARRALLKNLVTQCLLYSIRYGSDDEKVLAVLHSKESHTICHICHQHGVKPVIGSELADPCGSYTVIVAATQGMSVDRIDELIHCRPKQLLFGPANLDDKEHDHHHELPN